MPLRHPEAIDAITHAVTRKINHIRQESGYDSLDTEKGLEIAARSHARTMALHGELSHDIGDTTPQERADDYRNVSENIHRLTLSRTNPNRVAQNTVTAWYESDEHRANMLRSDASLGGVGAYPSGDTVYVCHLLASAPTIGQKVTARVNSLLSSNS
jgi:uncharacterized protein YkwD